MPEAGFQYADRAEKRESARLGMWIFLAGETLFFGALATAFVVCRLADPGGFEQAGGLTDLRLGTLNTVVLLTSGAAMYLGVGAMQDGAAQGDDRRAAWPWLAATAALGGVFLTVKGIEWHHDWSAWLVPGLHWRFAGRGRGDELFMWLYFVMTGIHVVHMLVGVVLVARLAAIGARGTPPSPLVVAMVGLYWAFVDLVWLFLFALLYLGGRA